MNEDKLINIYKFENFISLLNDGLIHTYPILTTIKLITREFNTIGLSARIDKEDETNTIFIKGYSESFIDKDITRLIRLISTCGYFPSVFEFYDKDDNFLESIIYKDPINTLDDINSLTKSSFFIQIIVESKFNKKVEPRDFLYHVAPFNKVSNILKIGLVPKSLKKAHHLDRIYLGYDILITKNLSYQFDHKGQYGLMRIDMRKNKLGDRINLYEDPDFPGHGCYTHENISPDNIELILKFNTNNER